MFKKLIRNFDLIKYDSEVMMEVEITDEETGEKIIDNESNTDGEIVKNKMLFLDDIDDVKFFRKSKGIHQKWFNLFGMKNIYFALNKSSDICETVSDSFNKALIIGTKWSSEKPYQSFTYGKLSVNCKSIKKSKCIKAKLLLYILKRLK